MRSKVNGLGPDVRCRLKATPMLYSATAADDVVCHRRTCRKGPARRHLQRSRPQLLVGLWKCGNPLPGSHSPQLPMPHHLRRSRADIAAAECGCERDCALESERRA